MKRTWNYRVIEIEVAPGEYHRSIREVHYEDGKPTMYSENPAVISWDSDETDQAALNILQRMTESLSKPVLRLADFEFSPESSD